MSEYNKAQKKAVENLDLIDKKTIEVTKIQKQYSTTLAKASAERTKEGKQLAKLKILRADQNKQIKQEIKLEKAAADSLVSMRAKLAKLTKEYDNASGALRTKLSPQIKRLTQEIQKNEIATGRHQRNVGNYPFRKLTDGFKSIATSMLGWTTVIYGVARAIGSLIKNSAEYQQSLRSLQAITGATAEDLEFYKKKSKETSKETLQSANEIIKAYELIGSARPELLKNRNALTEVTKSAIILGETTGGKLGLIDSAKTVTSVMNQMGKSASEAFNIINILAAGSKIGSANVLYLSEAFEKAGTTSNLMGLTVEETTGAIEAIAPFYDQASRAGNSFDKVLLKMQKEQIGYTNGVFDLNDAINELKVRYSQGETSAKIFGVEHAKMGQLLVNNQAKFNEYTSAVTGTTIALEQQEIQNNSLSANWKKLMNRIANASTDSRVAEFFNSILKWVLTAGIAITEFRNKFASDFNDIIDSSKGVRVTIAILGGTIKTTFEIIKGVIKTTLVNPMKGVGRLFKAIAKGDFKAMGDAFKEGFQDQKDTIIDIGKAFKENGKAIADAYSGEDLDKFKIKTKEVAETIDSEIIPVINEQTEALENQTEALENQREAAKKLADERRAQNLQFLKQETELAESYAKREITAEDYTAQVLANEIAKNKSIIASATSTDEEVLAARKKLADLTISETEREGAAQIVADDKRKAAKKKIYGASIDLINQGFSLSQALREREISDIEKNLAYQLSIGEKTDAQKAKLEEDAAKRTKAIQKEQAISSKRQAIFNSVITTAEAVINALATKPAPFGLILSGIVGALGVAQLGTIIATPIPQFEKGVMNFEGGLANVHEGEIVQQGNTAQYIDKKEQLMNLSKGANVYTQKEVQQMAAANAINHINFERNPQNQLDPEMINELKGLRKDVKNIQGSQINVTTEGIQYAAAKRHSTIKRIDTYFR